MDADEHLHMGMAAVADRLHEALRLLEAVDDTGLLFKHNVALDAEVAGFLHRNTKRVPQEGSSNGNR